MEDPADLGQRECGLGKVGGGPEEYGHDQALPLRRQHRPNLLDLGDGNGLCGLLRPLRRQHARDVVDERVQFASSLIH